jgi:hypothetical protein
MMKGALKQYTMTRVAIVVCGDAGSIPRLEVRR